MNAPVTSWENETVKGYALAGDRVIQSEMEKVEALRRRHADYLATLPVDLEEVIGAAQAAMHPGSEIYPGELEAAMHLARAVRPMVELLDVGDPGPDRDALLWIADRISLGLERTSRDLDHIVHILGNPARIRREARDAER